MKFQQQENRKIITTNCKECVFCDSQFEKQIGCHAGRLSQFTKRKEATKDEDDHFIINRFCNLYRNKSWAHAGEPDAVEKARKEVQASFCIVIFDEPRKSKIEDAVESVFNLDYPEDKIQVIISTPYQENITRYIDLTNSLKKKFKNSRLVINSLTSIKTQVEYDSFSKVINKSYFVKMNHDMVLPKTILSQIDHSLNIKVEKIVAFEYNNEKNKIFALPFSIVSNEYLKYNDFDLMCEGVIETAKQSNLFKQIDEK